MAQQYPMASGPTAPQLQANNPFYTQESPDSPLESQYRNGASVNDSQAMYDGDDYDATGYKGDSYSAETRMYGSGTAAGGQNGYAQSSPTQAYRESTAGVRQREPYPA